MTKNHPPLSKLDELGFRSYAIFVQSKLLSSIFDLEKLVEIAIDAFVELMRVDVGFIMLFNIKSQQLRVEAVKGLKSHTIRKTRINLDKDIIQGIIERKTGIFLSELEETLPIKILFQEMAEKVGGDIVLSIPLVIKKNLVGLVNLGRREFETPFEKADLQFLYTLAGYAAMAIENANLYQKKIEEQKMRITEHKRIEKKLRKYSEHLEEEVKKRTLAEEELKKYHENLEVLIEERTHEVQKLSQAVKQSPVSVVITDTRGDIEYVNPIFSKITGYSSEEIMGRNSRILNAGKLPKSYYKSMWDTILKGNNWSGEFINKKKNGEIFTESMSVSPIFDKADNITHFVAVKKDISEEKKLQENLIEAKQAADNANRAKSEFLANMSHEIRTPLNAIIGFSDMLVRYISDELQTSYLESIRSSGKSLLTLINDILDLSKIEAGKLELQYSHIDISSFFKEIEIIFSLRIKEKGLKFILDFNKNLPVTLYLDETRTRQILINLVGNAVKFTEAGHVKLSVNAFNFKNDFFAGKPVEYVDLIIEVEDTGIGIPKKSLKKIFKPFEQQEVQSTKKYGGTGLGLTICNRLVKLMDGELTVTSEWGKGSTFRLALKKIQISRTKITGDEKDMLLPDSIKFNEATIIIADDVKDNRKLLSGLLKEQGFKVYEAENGLEVLQLFDIIIPDLVITDIKMPEMDGYELINKIRNSPAVKNVPVIATSASVLHSDKAKFKKHNFDGFFFKPFQISELLSELSKHLPHKILEVKKEEKQEVLQAEYEISGDAIKNLPLIIKKLETEMMDEWNKFLDQQPMDKVKEFGNQIKIIGEENEIKILINYGKNLKLAVNNVDIEKMLKLIKDFPELLQKLKTHQS